MFGNNPVRKQEIADTLWVQEIFPTIQGEGPLAGLPAVFLRLAGCNLRCYWCDTDFETSDLRLTHAQTVQQVLEAAQRVRCNVVVVTGGEPFRQNVSPVILELADRGFHVQVETAGTLDLDDFPWGDPRVSVVVSPKTPKVNDAMYRAHAWKYIVAAGETAELDGLPVRSTQRQGEFANIARPLNVAPVYVQPRDEHHEELTRLNYTEAARICMKYGYRLSMQLHKLIGVP